MVADATLRANGSMVALTRFSLEVVRRANALARELGDSDEGKFDLIADKSVCAHNLDGKTMLLLSGWQGN